MGVSYFYLNHDKSQFFDCGLYGCNDRFAFVGSGPGARALAILLSDRGTWMGDRISVIADTSNAFEEAFVNGVDISVEAELMLLDVDGIEWLETRLAQPHSIGAFMDVCTFARLLRRSDATRALDNVFGAGKWQRKYAEHLQLNNSDTRSQAVLNAQSRGLKLLR